MKTKLLPTIILGLAAIAAISAAPRASAVPITFGGGGGTQLSFTLSQPVTYTITASAAGTNAIFVFQNVFASPLIGDSVSGSITFTINGGAVQTITDFRTGPNFGSITANDFILRNGPTLNFAVGDVVVLFGGTVTSFGNVILAAPANGNFNTYIASSNNGLRISTDGTTSVPESLATLWLALPVAAMFAARRFRIGAAGH